MPLELQLRIEPPVTGSLGRAGSDRSRRRSRSSRPVRFGPSAAVVPSTRRRRSTGSGRYGETIYNGEELFYRVKLDWGQGLAYRVTFGGRAGCADDQHLYRPVQPGPLGDEVRHDGLHGDDEHPAVQRQADRDPAVAYLNRNANDSDCPQGQRRRLVLHRRQARSPTATTARRRTGDDRRGGRGRQGRWTRVRRVDRVRPSPTTTVDPVLPPERADPLELAGTTAGQGTGGDDTKPVAAESPLRHCPGSSSVRCSCWRLRSSSRR